MINIVSLQQNIIDNPEHIKTILESLGYEDVRDRGKYYQCSNIDGDNPTAISILKSTLSYQNYTRRESGNIFTLVMNRKKLNFGEALRYTASKIGILKTTYVATKYPFHSFYKKLIRSSDKNDLNLKEYSADELPVCNGVSKRFFDDNISYEIQEQWGIRYNCDTDAIHIPIYDYNGNLVGCKSRNNTDNHENRWYAYLPYSKNSIVYGWYQNYKSISEQKRVFVFEAEKSVLQCATFGFNIAIAIAGHKISDAQSRYIKALMCDEIIIAFDEGIEEEELIFEAKKLLVNNKIYKNKVGYIYDKEHKYLKEGSKDSPSDNGRNVLEQLLKENVFYIKGEEDGESK